MKKSDALRMEAAARDMAEDSNYEWWGFIKLRGAIWSSIDFSSDDSNYELALAVVEGKPVFVGDVLYSTWFDSQFTVKGKYRNDGFMADIGGHTAIQVCSWNPPKPKTVIPDCCAAWDGYGIHPLRDNVVGVKPKTVMVELLVEDAKEFSFTRWTSGMNNRISVAITKALDGDK
tara:strand:- start:1297 stop:1818 length:522 start_codon:yes stop_codon:yes gene_type:complete